jgi:hypothetical protein
MTADPVQQIVDTLTPLQGITERPVWRTDFCKLADSHGSVTIADARHQYSGIGVAVIGSRENSWLAIFPMDDQQPSRSVAASLLRNMPLLSMNEITSCTPLRVFRLVMTKGLRPLTVVRIRVVSAAMTSKLAPT